MPDDSPISPDQFHVQEAIRHLHMAVENASCAVCAGLWTEEIEHLEMTEDLRVRAEQIAAIQAEKRAQLIERPGEAQLTREYVEVREHTGPEGPHREVVRGIESEPRRIGSGPMELARSWMRDRPRLVDSLNFGSR